MDGPEITITEMGIKTELSFFERTKDHLDRDVEPFSCVRIAQGTNIVSIDKATFYMLARIVLDIA